MAMDFPDSPAINETVSTAGNVYMWTGSVWRLVTLDASITAPIGTMMMWPVTSSYPSGWLRADGSAVSRIAYAALFEILGTAYGSGNGTSTFNLPSMIPAGDNSPVTLIKASGTGTIEPSTVSHASGHIRDGNDVIDGDRLVVDYVPTAYTRNAAADGAGNATDLTAHLAGVDSKLSTISSYQNRYARAKRASTSLTLNSNLAWANVDTNLDLTLTAAAGDVVEYAISALVDSAATALYLDVVSIVGGAPVNSFGYGTTPANPNTSYGVSGWYFASGASGGTNGSVFRTLAAGDISSGTVLMRLRYATGSATNRNMNATAAIPLEVWARNHGPVTT